jgi:ankyrin repeat protein
MEYLFDKDKPHFMVWRTLYDIDTVPADKTAFRLLRSHNKSTAAPLYYAALCGFHDLVGHLVIKYPQDVNASGGHYERPLVAALAGEHFETVELLRHNGADPRCQGNELRTPLHSAAYYGDLKMVQKLIKYDSDISAEDVNGWTPLHLASEGIHLKDRHVLQLLLEHGANVNTRAKDGSTPLHFASEWGALEVVHLLLEHGADVMAEDDRGRTALQVAGFAGYAKDRKDEIVKLLLEHEAK